MADRLPRPSKAASAERNLTYAEEQLEDCVLFLAQGDEDDPTWQAVNSLYAAVSALKRVIEEQRRG